VVQLRLKLRVLYGSAMACRLWLRHSLHLLRFVAFFQVSLLLPNVNYWQPGRWKFASFLRNNMEE
jgi:hypothetical protein